MANHMANRSRSLARLGAFLTIVLLTSFVARGAQAAPAPTSSMPAPSQANINKKLRQAAEPFENLTEIAFSTAWPKIDKTVGEAEGATAGVRGSLSKDAAGQLDTQLSTMKTTRQNKDRVELALSSIEVYRILVSAVTDNAKVPTEVNLLDYAGFRYDANLKASPIRWDDMTRTVSFAHKTWGALLPRAKASPVAVRFAKVIADMDKASLFWVIKIAATTLGETGGDAVSMSMKLGYLVGTGISLSFFWWPSQRRSRRGSFTLLCTG
jgi:Repeat of Unknown Function (DUF347)